MNDEKLFYNPLKPGEIRVLKPRSFEELSFDLSHVKLKKNPKYSALSYTWGSNILNRQILLNGHPFWITESLYLALQQFQQGLDSKRLQYPLKGLFWVDAICVNQNTSTEALQERGTQVFMMTTIYEKAKTVFVWLGPPEDIDQNRAAADKLKAMEEAFMALWAKRMPYQPWHWPYRPIDSVSVCAKIFHTIGQNEIASWTIAGEQAWHGIIHLWKSPWWTRAWAHQEGTVIETKSRINLRGAKFKFPRAKVNFICGELCTTWNRQAIALQMVNELLVGNPEETTSLKGSTFQFRKLHWAKLWRSHAESIGVLDALNLFRLASCQDPRDKVYAATGLVTRENEKIVPNYEISVYELYKKVVSTSLNSSGLDFLGYASKIHDEESWLASDANFPKLPSWVPNWRVPAVIAPFPKMLHIQTPTSMQKPGYLVDRRMAIPAHTAAEVPAYNACGSFNSLDACIDGRYLRSSGVHVDTIRETVRFAVGRENLTFTLTGWRTQLATSRYSRTEDFDRALRRVHCGDVQFKALPNITPVARGYEIDNAVLLKKPDELPESNKADLRRDMGLTLSTITPQRSLCVTRADRLALVPYTCEPGDKICMFLGSRVLYALRPVELSYSASSADVQTHEYLGEVYVDGIMDGEVSNMVDANEESIETFVLE